jgi:imidazolonepropionase-like amidohydrolase
MHAVARPGFLALSLSLLLFQWSAERAAADESAPAARILIRAGVILDTHSGKETADQTIIVTGGLISAIAATADTPRQATDREIDLRGMTVLPGLIDVHTHLTMDTNFDP